MTAVEQLAMDGKGIDCGHRAWCAPQECYYSEGTRVHAQAPTRWEDETAALAVESRLLDPADDATIYLELSLRDLRMRWDHYFGVLPVGVVRRLRDQLTEHLDAVEGSDPCRDLISRPGAGVGQ